MSSSALKSKVVKLQRCNSELERRLHQATILIDDMLSTYRQDDKTTLVTSERQEMWLQERNRIAP